MWHSLGKVTITNSGTPVQATTNETVPAKRFPAQTIFFQQVQSNTGKLYIMDRSNGVKGTGVGVLAVIAAPTLSAGVATVLPYAAVTIPTAPTPLNAADFWIDADNSAEACQVSVVRA